MREIKFRAWDKTMNMMIYQDDTEFEFRLTGKGIEVDDLTFVDTAFNEKHEDIDCVLMQYTGLKDRHGKEIYEGDIVKVTDANDEISELNSDTGIGAIEWLDKWGFWNISRIENSLGDINNSYYIEVIGNIYENVDLLEVAEDGI